MAGCGMFVVEVVDADFVEIADDEPARGLAAGQVVGIPFGLLKRRDEAGCAAFVFATLVGAIEVCAARFVLDEHAHVFKKYVDATALYFALKIQQVRGAGNSEDFAE